MSVSNVSTKSSTARRAQNLSLTNIASLILENENISSLILNKGNISSLILKNENVRKDQTH